MCIKMCARARLGSLPRRGFSLDAHPAIRVSAVSCRAIEVLVRSPSGYHAPCRSTRMSCRYFAPCYIRVLEHAMRSYWAMVRLRWAFCVDSWSARWSARGTHVRRPQDYTSCRHLVAPRRYSTEQSLFKSQLQGWHMHLSRSHSLFRISGPTKTWSFTRPSSHLLEKKNSSEPRKSPRSICVISWLTLDFYRPSPISPPPLMLVLSPIANYS